MVNALAQRAIACKPWFWISGMLTTCGVRVIEGRHDYLIGHRQGATRDGGGWVDTGDAVGFLPDLTDPATLGCLLALVREAWGAQVFVASYPDDSQWLVQTHSGFACDAPTEAEALVAALEAAP